MRYTELGHTGMSLSSLAFGASSLGSVFHETKEKESIKLKRIQEKFQNLFLKQITLLINTSKI